MSTHHRQRVPTLAEDQRKLGAINCSVNVLHNFHRVVAGDLPQVKQNVRKLETHMTPVVNRDISK